MSNTNDAPDIIWAIRTGIEGAVEIGAWADTVRHHGGTEYERRNLADARAAAAWIAGRDAAIGAYTENWEAGSGHSLHGQEAALALTIPTDFEDANPEIPHLLTRDEAEAQTLAALTRHHEAVVHVLTNYEAHCVRGVQVVYDDPTKAGLLLRYITKAATVSYLTHLIKDLDPTKTTAPKIDTQAPVWPQGGYAPGSYWCKCVSCDQQFTGDKRAYQCPDCVIQVLASISAAAQAMRFWLQEAVGDCMEGDGPNYQASLHWIWDARAALEATEYTAAPASAVPDDVTSISAAREAAAWIAGRDAAVKLNDQQIQDYVSEHGMYDGSTGITEFPGDGEEWVGDREELSDAIRDLTPPTDPAALDRLIAERVREAVEAMWGDCLRALPELGEDNPSRAWLERTFTHNMLAIRAARGSKEGRDG